METINGYHMLFYLLFWMLDVFRSPHQLLCLLSPLFPREKTMALAQCRALHRANARLATPKAWRLRGRRGNSAGLVVESALGMW